MAGTRRQDRLALQGLHAYTWVVAATLVVVVVCAVLQVGFVRPYLYPAGAGAIVSGEAAGRLPLIARPPDVRNDGAAGTVIAVAGRSPAADAAVAPGHQVLSQVTDGPAVDFSRVRNAAPAERLAVWRDSYRLGVRGPAWWQLESGGGTRRVLLDRPAAWRTPLLKDWAALHAGMIIQIIVFTGGALLLFALRSNDLTAALSVLALGLSATGGGGPLLGAEHSIPIAGRVLTVFAWMASPLAFPVIALAILYFPSRSPLLVRFPLLHVVPFAVAGPMLVLGGATALYLTGVEGARRLAAWDAAHPAVYYGSFAAALGVNLLAIAEGVYRYRFNHDANERRRIRMAVYTAVPGVIAYALKDGVPIVARLGGFEAPLYPVAVATALQALVLLPAFGLVYAVGVERVLGPRVVLRRSLQYALASQTLTALAVLPAAALVVSLVRNRQMSIADAAASGSGLYVALIAASVAAFAFRDRVRLWLDQRFFREEYDGRKILISLASRVRFETDPADLASLVVRQIDEALHPETTAILVSGVDEGLMTPVTVLHGTADALPLDGGLVSMLRWSEEPLEIFMHDPRSPAHRLPPEEQAWLECTGATLLVPVLGQERALIGLIALGEKRSEEAYTKEDRELLASIAGQMGLGFDVARLQLRSGREAEMVNGTTRVLAPAAQPMAECARCGRCEDGGTAVCPGDGAPMQQVPSIPRIVDSKYRLE